MEDSEVIFEQRRDTAETMEQEGLLPSGHNEKMELRTTQFQDGTRLRSREFDIRGEEELEAAGGGSRNNINDHDDEKIYGRRRDLKLPHVGFHRGRKAISRVDLWIG